MKNSSGSLFRSLRLPLAGFLAISLLAACGKKEEEKQAEPAPQPAALAPAPIIITGNDQMQFSLKTIEVAAGQPVVIILQNIGTMPKEAMGHNLTILKPGSVVADFATKAMAAKETDYFPVADSAMVLAHTRLLGPGESDTLTFTAPPAGEYPFLCTFPGHFAMMQGVLTSK